MYLLLDDEPRARRRSTAGAMTMTESPTLRTLVVVMVLTVCFALRAASAAPAADTVVFAAEAASTR